METEIIEIENIEFPISVITNKSVFACYRGTGCCCQRGCRGCNFLEITPGETLTLEGIPVRRDSRLTQFIQTKVREQTIILPWHWFERGFKENILSVTQKENGRA